MEDPLERLRDQVARQDEHSHVDDELSEFLGRQQLHDPPRRLLDRLFLHLQHDLRHSPAHSSVDWLDAQMAI